MSINAKESPRQFQAFYEAGPGEWCARRFGRQLALGIYKFDGDKLTMCSVHSSQPRPADFKARGKDVFGGIMVDVFERKKTDKAKNQTIPSASRSGQGFSFESGGLVVIKDDKTRNYDTRLDFFWDVMGNGLVANNQKHGRGFVGNAQMADLGKIELHKVEQIPDKGWCEILLPKKGHTYCVKMSNGNGMGLIRVIELDVEQEILVISWEIMNKKVKR
jgi:hypothetical protein